MPRDFPAGAWTPLSRASHGEVGCQGTPWSSCGKQFPEWAAKGATSDESDHSPAARDWPRRVIASSLLKDEEPQALSVGPSAA